MALDEAGVPGCDACHNWSSLVSINSSRLLSSEDCTSPPITHNGEITPPKTKINTPGINIPNRIGFEVVSSLISMNKPTNIAKESMRTITPEAALSSSAPSSSPFIPRPSHSQEE